MAPHWRRYKSSHQQALRTPRNTTWCTLQRTRYGASPASAVREPQLVEVVVPGGNFTADKTTHRLVLPESCVSSWEEDA